MDTEPEISLENSTKRNLPKFLTTVTPLSKSIAMVILIVFPFVGFYLGIKYQRIISIPTSDSLLSITVPTPDPAQPGVINSSKADFLEWHLISKKKYKDFEIGAFDLSGVIGGPDVPVPSLFVVALLNKSNQPLFYWDSYVASNIPEAYYNENIFDVVSDRIYIIDSQLNSIKIFTADYKSATLSTPELYTMSYITSVPAPRYNIGRIYTIKCESNSCTIRSAFHQESGCEFNLNTDTLKYSIPVCRPPGPDGADYTPESI